MTETRGRVHARHILRDRDLQIDVQHFLDHLVLTEVDVALRNGEKQRLEHGPGAGMITGQKCPTALAKIVADFIRIRVGDSSGGVGEYANLVNYTRRLAARLPACVALRRAGHERIRDCRSLIVVEAVEDGTDERPQLRGRHRFEHSVEIGIRSLAKTGASAAWASHAVPRASSDSLANCTSARTISSPCSSTSLDGQPHALE